MIPGNGTLRTILIVLSILGSGVAIAAYADGKAEKVRVEAAKDLKSHTDKADGKLDELQRQVVKMQVKQATTNELLRQLIKKVDN